MLVSSFHVGQNQIQLCFFQGSNFNFFQIFKFAGNCLAFSYRVLGNEPCIVPHGVYCKALQLHCHQCSRTVEERQQLGHVAGGRHQLGPAPLVENVVYFGNPAGEENSKIQIQMMCYYYAS